MADTETQEYGKRYLFNAALLTLVLALGWAFFNAHVKPYAGTVIFSGVSFSTIVVFAATMFGSFVDVKTILAKTLRGWLHKAALTLVLLAAMPVIAVAYATTFTLSLTARRDSPDVKVNVRRGDSSKTVVLSAAQPTKAVTYFSLVPVNAQIETLSPSGFKPVDLALHRGLPRELAVPDPASQKKFYLVRLIPMYDLFQLRGRKQPDLRYTLRVFLPGIKRPIVHPGLTFSALYLGASLPDLQAQAKAARGVTNDLHDTLNGYDRTMHRKDVDTIIDDWLTDPQFIPTPELKPGDVVRVVLESPAGKSEGTVKVVSPVNSVFLSGAAE